MVDGDTVYSNPLLADRHLLFLVTGTALPVDDLTGSIDWSGSIDRHVEKAFNSDSANVVGAVMHNEIVEVYAFI